MFDTDLELINKSDVDVIAGRGGSPYVCRNAKCGRGGRGGGLWRAHKHVDGFRQRSEERLLAGHAEEEPRDTSQCRQTSPHPNPPGKTRGETCVPFSDEEEVQSVNMRVGWGGHAEGVEVGGRSVEDADVQCGGEGRPDGRRTTSDCLGRTGADPRERHGTRRALCTGHLTRGIKGQRTWWNDSL